MTMDPPGESEGWLGSLRAAPSQGMLLLPKGMTGIQTLRSSHYFTENAWIYIAASAGRAEASSQVLEFRNPNLSAVVSAAASTDLLQLTELLANMVLDAV